MNRMLVTIGTKFYQFQSTRRIVSILLSNISGNAPRFLINIVSDTTVTFQNNLYSDIFTLGHKPPFFLFTQLFYFRNEEEKKKLLTRTPIMKYCNFIAIKSIENISNTMISNYPLVIVFHLSILYAFVVRDLYYLLYIFVLPLLIQREPEFRCG